MLMQSNFLRPLMAVLTGWCFTTLGGAFLWAQPPGERGGPDGFRPPTSPLMEALDRNGDHRISAEELAAAVESLTGLDRNGDGELSMEEVMPPRPNADRAGRPGPGRDDGPPPRGDRADRGGPDGPPRAGNRPPRAGDLPPREGDRPPRQRDAEEGRGPGRPGPDPEQMVEHAMEFDANGDGMLSREELLAFAKSIPERRDGAGGPPEGPRPPRDGNGPGGRPARPQRPGSDG